MPRLIVQRKSEQDIKMRDLLVRVDDGPQFNLNFGQSKEFDIEPGDHTLHASNRLYSDTTTFSINENETLTYEVANLTSGCIAALFIGLGMGLYRVRIERLKGLPPEERQGEVPRSGDGGAHG